MSILLRPQITPNQAPMLTLVMACSVAEGIMDCKDVCGEQQIQIKWPNDVILHERKICGILTEMGLEMDEISYVVIGVGFNINRESFPEELAGTATSIYGETGRQTVRAAFLADFIREFSERYRTFLQVQDLEPFKEEYERRLVNIGREVRIIRHGQEIIRRAEGINEKGELLVRSETGEIECICRKETS